MSDKIDHPDHYNWIRTSEACRMTGLTPKTLLRIATLNGVRVRKFPGMERMIKYHKADLLKLLAKADRWNDKTETNQTKKGAE
jgi:hypothetical protein